MPQSRFFQINPIRRRQDTSDVNRGLQVGQEVGKLLGGLAGAIKGAQKDALANKLMTDQSISEQPGAGVAQDLGKLPDGSGGDGGGGAASDDQLRQAMAASQLSSSFGQPQDLGQLPSGGPMTPGPSGAQEPVPTPAPDSSGDLASAMAASRLGGGPTVGTMAGGPQPNANPPPGAAGIGGTDFSLRPQDLATSGPANTQTVGGLMHTGGVEEMNLQKEMMAMQIQKQGAQARTAAIQAKAADAAAKAAGTGIYALPTAQARADLAKTQLAIEQAKAKAGQPDKNAQPANITEEPVTDQNQLTNHIDGLYGKGTTANIAATLNEEPTIPDPKNPGGTMPDPNNPGQTIPAAIPNPNAPAVTGDSVTVGPKNRRITMPITQAQIYARQANVLRLKNGLPALRVPGEDQTVGRTADNPFIAHNNLEVYSREPGTWIRLPNGQVAQVPARKRQ
jgi:hypothetical protein